MVKCVKSKTIKFIVNIDSWMARVADSKYKSMFKQCGLQVSFWGWARPMRGGIASSHWLSPYPEWSLGVVTNYGIRDTKSLIYTIKYAHGFVVVWLLQRYSISHKICTIMLCFVLLWYIIISRFMNCMNSLIARFMRPTWGSSGTDRTQVGPMLAPWTLLSGLIFCRAAVH